MWGIGDNCVKFPLKSSKFQPSQNLWHNGCNFSDFSTNNGLKGAYQLREDSDHNPLIIDSGLY